MSDRSGFVYVMTKEDLPFYYKVGCTEKKPHLRANELDGTDSPLPSIVTYYVYCSDFQRLETEAHRTLADYRVRQNREWFKCTRSEAIDAIGQSATASDIEIYFEKGDLADPHLSHENRERDQARDDGDIEADIDPSDPIADILDSFSYYSILRNKERNNNKTLLEGRLANIRRQETQQGRRRDLRDSAKESYFKNEEKIRDSLSRSLFWQYGHLKATDSNLFTQLAQLAAKIEDGESLTPVLQETSESPEFRTGIAELDKALQAFSLKNLGSRPEADSPPPRSD